jgi:transcriptional regulator with XRE-family HTH domain
MPEIDPAQSVTARDLLKMSLQDLAHAANVGLGTLTSFEAGVTSPTPNTLRSIRIALQEAGVEIIAGDVRLKTRP